MKSRGQKFSPVTSKVSKNVPHPASVTYRMYVLKNCCVQTTYGNTNLAIEDFTLLQSTALANALLYEPYGLCHAVQPIQS
jgi:hypothetical protein